MQQINPYCVYNPINSTLIGIHQSGFYSCINTVRLTLYELISKKIIPNNISFANTLHWYKSKQTDDFYPLLYKPFDKNKSLLFKQFQFKWFCPTLISYDTIEFSNILDIEKLYFSPSDLVLKKITELEQKYNIDYSNTLVVLHRGNDKWREATLLNPEQWINEIEKIPFSNKKNTKILIQTDEINMKDKLIKHFQAKCFFFEEMIFSNSYSKPICDFEEWAVTFESVMRILSKCKFLITHSGNCGFVPVLYRGNTINVIQLLCSGKFKNLFI